MLCKRSWIHPCVLVIALALAGRVEAQHRRPLPVEGAPAGETADSAGHHLDSARRPAPPVRPYKDVITADVKTSRGYFLVHRKNDRYYFEVPTSLYGRDILFVNRIAKASADMRNGSAGYAGDQIGESVYRFEAGPSHKLFLRRISFSEYENDSTRSLFAAVQKNNVQAIAMAWPIAAYKPDSSAVVVDATDFLNSDNDVLYFERRQLKERAGMGAQINDRSYIDYIHTFSSNIEVHAVKTYTAGLNPAWPDYTVELSSSMVLLPEKPMAPRMQDERVGYFTTRYRDFEADPQGVKITSYIKRWRLEPKPEDRERYERGELVDPAKPIVFYIDPATPKKWVPYLIAGVNDWNKAFEQAGFKNAIIGRTAPTKEEDSTWSIDDANHSAILYRPSQIANAQGPSVADPRSGEIIESHIFWYHNVMSLLHKWYLVQCGATDPRARKPELDDSLMGTLIRFVSSHEVGHALGLMHNFGSSSTVPVEKLRDKAWVEAHGHTPSIMDYARFNYVAQPEDHVGEAGLFPRIGDYDKWAIKWGYKLYPGVRTPEEEHRMLVPIVTDSLKQNHRLWFGGEMEPFDARCQNEDLGDNAMLAGMYGIKNLQRVYPHLIQWTMRPGDNYEGFKDYVAAVWSQYSTYLGHVLKNVGTLYKTVKVVGEPGPLEVMAPYEVHKSAMRFLNEQFFQTPLWLNNDTILDKLPMISFGIELANTQKDVIELLVTRSRMSRLLWWEESSTGKPGPAAKVYTLSEFFDDLNHGIFTELYEHRNVDAYRRNLQKTYVARLMQQAFTGPDFSMMEPAYTYHIYQTDIPSLIKDALRQQQRLFRSARANPSLDKMTRLHLQEMDDLIEGQFRAEKDGK
jgi:hypothetical protein